MIRLAAADMDNTLLPEGTFDLNPEYYDVVRALKEKGILFVAASGRHYSSIRKLWEPLKDEIAFLGGNGSVVMYRDEVLSANEIPREDYAGILRAMREAEPDVIITDHPDFIYTDYPENDLLRWMKKGYRTEILQCEDLAQLGAPILKTAMYVPEDAQICAERLRARFEGRMNIMSAGDHWVDVVANGADKGSSLRVIQKMFGISREETIAFGDNGNDIGMMKLAGRSYAVANARDEVKEIADEVIGPMEEDAVLKVLKSLL